MAFFNYYKTHSSLRWFFYIIVVITKTFSEQKSLIIVTKVRSSELNNDVGYKGTKNFVNVTKLYSACTTDNI